jgi:type I restriction enzyme S subunit
LSANSNINQESLKSISVKLPPLSQQKKIAEILTTCDEIIAQTEAAISKYKAIKQGMVQDLFTRGIDPQTHRLRPTPQEKPELYKDSELGLIPKEWEVKSLEEIAEIFYGKDYKSNPKGDNVPIYGTGGIMGYTSVILNSGPAVLTGRKGSINNPIYLETDFWNVDTIFCIKTREELSNKWLYYQFTQIDLTKLNEATGVPSVSSKSLYKLNFAVPYNSEIKSIETRIESVSKNIESEESALQKYQQVKAGLMQDLLTGNVAVGELE